jgi:pyruvate kinase
MQTKIITTIGPKSESSEVMEEMSAAGCDIFRVNFSHSNPRQFLEIQKNLKNVSKKLKKDIKIMQDLQGPRIRVGVLPANGISLHENKTYAFCSSENGSCHPDSIPIDCKNLHEFIKKGDPFYLANGEIELYVVKVTGANIYATVLEGGILTSHKAVNIPKTNLLNASLTKKDIKDAKLGIKNNVDYIALSFVQTGEDVKDLRKLIGNNKKIKIIAKIERGLALDNIDEIIRASDGIMIARGDLGIEIPLEQIPVAQKNLIRHAHWHNKPAIVATQMLTSMIQHPHPTRAEVSDIANAIFDGADGVMLSDETAIGLYPVKAVSYMKKIINYTEKNISQENFFEKKL